MRVLDVTMSIAGPYCAQILSALGADVIKVERPDTGDDGRAWGSPFWDGEGTMFLSANAGKRSLAISLRDPRGRDALLRLAAGADVFLQSLRPGPAEELGLGADGVRAHNRRLVYCSVGAYGRVGPLRDQPGYDALMQAVGGLISMTGEPGGAGVCVGSSLIDQGTGTWAALGVLAALLEREQTGEGSVVDVSLYETALGCIGYHLAGYLADGTRAPRPGHTVPDGRSVRGVSHPRRGAHDRGRKRPALCVALRRRRAPGADRRRPLWHEPAARAEQRRAVRAARAAAASRRHGRVAGEALGGRCSRRTRCRRRRHRARTPDRGARDPAAARASENPGLRLAALPISFDGERALHRSAPPAIGEHSQETLREAGYDDAEIAALAADGVIRI